MSCVNIKHKDFIALINATGVSAANLEAIIHEYQNALGDTEAFPTAEYVINRLTNPNIVTSESQIELWENLYKTPKVFSSKEALDLAIAEATNYYSKEAISTWKDNKGNYVMKVAEPTLSNEVVEKEYEEILAITSRNKEDVTTKSFNIKSATNNVTFDKKDKDFYRERIADYNINKGRDTKIRNLFETGTKENAGISEVSIVSIVDIIEGSQFSTIISLLKNKFGNKKDKLLKGIKVKLVSPLSFYRGYESNTIKSIGFNGRRALYNAASKTIYINVDADYDNGDSSAVLLHEIMHAITVDRILSNQEAREKFEQILKDYQKSNVDFRYSTLNDHALEEFIANIWSDPSTIENLKNIKSPRLSKQSLWDEIKQFFSNLFSEIFSGTSSDSLMAEASIEMIKLLESPIIINSEENFQESINSYAETSDEGNVDSFIEETQDAIAQINNLYDNNIISASEIRHLADQAVYWISDHITSIQENPSLLVEIYGEGLTNFDVKNATRAEIVQAIGPKNLIALCQKQFFPDATRTKRSTNRKARLIIQNWKGFMKLASYAFANMEDFAIVEDEVTTDINADADNFNDSNTESEVVETEGDLQEHWQIETKTLDVLRSMSQLVRQALTKCYILEKNINGDGEVEYKKITSEFGINERVNARDATNSILRWTQGSITLENMIDKLQAKVDANPWVSQIIERLSDNSGKEADFQSQFFGVFCKHFQSYSVVVKDEKTGEYKSISVNEFPALRDAVNSIVAQYNIGEHPMFNPSGVNEKTFNEFKEVYNTLSPLRNKFNSVNLEDAATQLGYAANTLGYYVTPEMVKPILNARTFERMLDAMGYMVNSIEKNLNNQNYNPFEFKSKDGIRGKLREFLQPITDVLEDTAVSSFYDSGKMYQSYITPSYMSKLMNKFNLQGAEFDKFIMEEYGAYEFFKFKGKEYRKIGSGWRNAWLDALVNDSKTKEIFKHKVQLNFNKYNYMRNMSDTEYLLSIITEYFSESISDKVSRVPAWFRIPMLSNKPSSEFIRFYSERGTNYKNILTDGFKMIFDQELSRIQTIKMRGLKKGDQGFIKNLDGTRGTQFCFLSFMNTYLNGKDKNSELGQLINAKLEGKVIDEVRLEALAKKAIYEAMDTKAESIVAKWENDGILEGAKKISGIGKEDAEVRENLINFVWNDTFAAMNILQLTITDIAYYKDAEDIQKRLAQIHAPGVRGNVAATDYEGNRVTDGYERTFYLTDFDDFKSNIKENIAIVFDRKIATAKPGEKEGYKALKESILKQFDEINVADAQGYSSPTSYRKKAFIFGKWSTEAENIYQKLKSGEYTYSDLETAFQPLKPFVYSQINKSSNTEEAPLSTLKVPVQNKNSEYLLILADAILQGEDTGRPNLLRAIYEVMEESAEGNNIKGIDTVQFESTVKSGLMGPINIKQFQYAENGEAKAKAAMRAAIYLNGKDGEYNENYVHSIPFEDYCLQQEVPAHFKDHEQAHGSQIRYIIPSDLEEIDYLGNPVTYEVEGRKLTAEEFKVEYENTIAENIAESIEELSNELHINGTIKERNIALSKILQKEILASPRYGVDLLQACSVDENGNFRIPLGDPIQSKRVEQLINSIIKNRVNKQTIAGGPVVQVSNFGTSKELSIRFYSKETDKNGKKVLLKTRKEFEGSDEDYKEYIKKNQAGIAYFEVFAPIYANNLFTTFADSNGFIDIKAIEAIDPDLLKMIGYRIPTEDKYSIAPLKIVGFLPREAGDGIMLPNDITLLNGSDFDVDKMYLMRKEIPLKPRSKKEVFNLMYDKLLESKVRAKYKDKQLIGEELEMFLDNPQLMKAADALHRYMWELYKRVAYEANPPLKGRTYRNNKIVDMTYEVLTHETTADKILNPGGFEPQKRMGYLVEAYRNPVNATKTWEDLKALDTSDLKDLSYTDKNLCFIDTHVQFYRQNSAAGALIGTFAVHKVAHAVLESNEYTLNVDEILKGNSFILADMEFAGAMTFDSKYDRNGQLIGKTLGSLVGSAADAVKDPVLNLMNINSITSGYLTTLIRMGMPFDDAALFLSQSVITDIIAEYNKEKISKYVRFGDIIADKIQKIEDEHKIDENSPLQTEGITEEELIEGIKPNAKIEIQYKVLKALQNIQKLNDNLKGPTFATRFNSISSAVGPQIIDNLIIEYKMGQFSENIYGPNGENIIMPDILQRHPILGQFAATVEIAKQLFQGMSANSTGFRQILDTMPRSLADIIYRDRKLFNSLSDFYQSYLMLDKVVDSRQLPNYTEGFPRWFLKQGFKEKYKDNALIQAIKLEVNKETGRVSLKVDTTGLDTQQKEILSSAWIDLHKDNPELSTHLFMYNFFKTGIGFSPKSFMSLVPVYIKERIPGYTETFRVLPSVMPENVIDQFIRNNWGNDKLVPRKRVKYRLNNGTLEIYKADEVSKMKNVPYFKMEIKGVDTLWVQTGKSDTAVYYTQIDPLGNNGEYLEISTEVISKSKKIPVKAQELNTDSQVENTLNHSIDNMDLNPSTPNRAEERETAELIYRILENGKTILNREQAVAKFNEFKGKSKAEKKSLESGMKKFIKNRLEKLGISYDASKIDELYKAMC